MMQLTIAEPDTPAPDPPEVSDPSATVWRDDADGLIALGHTVAGQHWLHLVGVGAFSFPPAAGDVTAIPDAGVPGTIIEDAFRRVVLPFALQAQGREVLHASAVRTGDGVIALCAVSGTGKSTLACALSRRGHLLWADDAVCLELNEDGVHALPLPFTLRLLPTSVAFFGDDALERGVRTPAQSEPLRAVFVLQRSENGEPTAERLNPTTAFREVLPHGYCFSLNERDRNGAMMRNYLELADRVPIFRVTFSAGLDKVDEVAGLIESASR